jgi:hypothetical protein
MSLLMMFACFSMYVTWVVWSMLMLANRAWLLICVLKNFLVSSARDRHDDHKTREKVDCCCFHLFSRLYIKCKHDLSSSYATHSPSNSTSTSSFECHIHYHLHHPPLLHQPPITPCTHLSSLPFPFPSLLINFPFPHSHSRFPCPHLLQTSYPTNPSNQYQHQSSVHPHQYVFF